MKHAEQEQLARQAVNAWWSNAHLAALGNGHIHHTYLVWLDEREDRFVLQAANSEVFADPLTLTEQMLPLLEHLRADAAYSQTFAVPELVPTTGGQLVHHHGGKLWRVWRYIEHSRVIDPFTNAEQIESAAWAFGAFQRSLAAFHPQAWVPPIPGFLELSGYLRSYRQHSQAVPNELPADLQRLVDVHQTLVDALGPERTFIHGDCKINNLLFQAQQDQVLGVIDLDTVGQGHWAWDFGDLVRSVAFSHGGVDLDQFRTCVRGFYQGRRDLDQAQEVTATQMSLAPAYIALTLGVRFLTDHLQGDRYFRVAERGENIHRAEQQLRLLERFSALRQELYRTALVGLSDCAD